MTGLRVKHRRKKTTPSKVDAPPDPTTRALRSQKRAITPVEEDPTTTPPEKRVAPAPEPTSPSKQPSTSAQGTKPLSESTLKSKSDRNDRIGRTIDEVARGSQDTRVGAHSPEEERSELLAPLLINGVSQVPELSQLQQMGRGQISVEQAQEIRKLASQVALMRGLPAGQVGRYVPITSQVAPPSAPKLARTPATASQMERSARGVAPISTTTGPAPTRPALPPPRALATLDFQAHAPKVANSSTPPRRPMTGSSGRHTGIASPPASQSGIAPAHSAIRQVFPIKNIIASPLPTSTGIVLSPTRWSSPLAHMRNEILSPPTSSKIDPTRTAARRVGYPTGLFSVRTRFAPTSPSSEIALPATGIAISPTPPPRRIAPPHTRIAPPPPEIAPPHTKAAPPPAPTAPAKLAQPPKFVRFVPPPAFAETERSARGVAPTTTGSAPTVPKLTPAPAALKNPQLTRLLDKLPTSPPRAQFPTSRAHLGFVARESPGGTLRLHRYSRMHGVELEGVPVQASKVLTQRLVSRDHASIVIPQELTVHPPVPPVVPRVGIKQEETSSMDVIFIKEQPRTGNYGMNRARRARAPPSRAPPASSAPIAPPASPASPAPPAPRAPRRLPEADCLVLPTGCGTDFSQWTPANCLEWTTKLIEDQDPTQIELLTGLKLNRYGLRDLATEKDVWKEVGMPWGLFSTIRANYNKVHNVHNGYE